MKDALIALAAFALQTLSVFAFNSRLFGLLKPGSGFYTNVEMAMSYTSLVTPARWAFAIWGIIYTWESVALTYLFLASDVPGWNLRLWLLANAFQAIWAPLFSTERLAASTVALAGIAVSLVSLGASLRCASGLAYGLIAAPIWLHAGWACAASIVNLNLTFAAFGTPAATQLAVAFASAAISGGLGVGIVSQVVSAESTALAFAPLPLAGALCWALAAVRAEQVVSAESTALAFAPLPLAGALCWALAAVRAELRTPDLIKDDKAYAAIGEVGRDALEMVLGASAAGLAIASLVLVALRMLQAQGLLKSLMNN
eukprot:CAMPEP_0174757076 /NCGR_PEP_ID=MMETSP1094-20130205/107080_1 /TAXON_ID=156173 /ORGANISM="Chrysochromulina brevifilum, Strain UTEX LB 985" /LENGTH=313 /DNA_ID=CAMNT_0015962991 /DNA_START=39 /DNA_END=980 /DNA_ORIENTATION=-